MKKIKFTLEYPDLEYCAEFPSPAIKNLPEWYKNTPSFINNTKEINDGVLNETVKKCIPVLDAMSYGYIIKLWTDVYVDKNNQQYSFHTSVKTNALNAVSGHNISQASGYPFKSDDTKEIFKWNNPWNIKTEKGYSCLFITPLHHDLPFRILEGVVDTDTFPLNINFPFILNKNFSGVITRGTPIAQVIPFKREGFKSISGQYNESEHNKLINLHDTTFTNKYKLKWWSRKKYE